jgi:predicted Mrr-cat superfamily restriction endonuclease
MVHKIFSITTYNDNEFVEEVAEEWKRLGICAIGWASLGRLDKFKNEKEIIKRLRRRGRPTRNATEIWRFLKDINKGDIIFAYTKDNTIAYIGEVKNGKYEFNEDNVIGEEYEYPNQKSVDWWDEPHHFDRHDLPREIAEQFGKRGVIVAKIDVGSRGAKKIIEIVKLCAKSGSKLGLINEDIIKAGLVKFLYRSIDRLELGLKIEKVESVIGKKKRPDFIAKDSKGKTVIIECKGTAGAEAVDQIKSYEKLYGKGFTPRLIIVAYKIDESCRSAARKAKNVELFECDLYFQRLKI